MKDKHPWHNVEVGKNAPEKVNMIVEISKGSNIKYEIDKDTGLLMLDRVMYSAMYYPGDYGFIPKTLWDDGDPLDVIVFTYQGILPMTICEVKVIGIMHMIDDGESDAKIIAVHAADPRFAEKNDITDIPPHTIKEIKHFFATYKDLQDKKTEISKVEGKEAAYEAIKKSQELYNEKYGNKE